MYVISKIGCIVFHLLIHDSITHFPYTAVRFRVFAILPNLRPYMGNVDVTIYDPKGNQMKKLRNHRGNGGYASGVMKIALCCVSTNYQLVITSYEAPQTLTMALTNPTTVEAW